MATVKTKVKGELVDIDVSASTDADLHRILSRLYETRLILFSNIHKLKGPAIDRRLSALSRITADIVTVRSELDIRGVEVADLFATQFMERAARVLEPDTIKRIMDGI